METLTPVPSRINVSVRPRTSPFKGGTCVNTETAGGAQSAALAAVHTLEVDCNNANAVVNQNILGPYADNGSCGYDCSYEQNWSWSLDYRSVNSNLVYAVYLMDMARSYTLIYQPTQTWITTDLPNFSTALLADLTAANFTDAGNVLQNNINEMNNAFRNVTLFISNSNQYVGYLQTYASNIKTWIIANATGVENDLIGKIACGAGDVQNSFNKLFADVNAKFANMATPFNTVNNDYQLAQRAVQLVAGIFLSLQSKGTSIGQNITKAAAEPPNSPLRTMYVNIATNEWNDFVSEANTQLGS